MMNVITIHMPNKNEAKHKPCMVTGALLFLLLLCAIPLSTQATEVTGRFSMLGTTAYAKQGDSGYITENNTLTADQQSLRVMADNAEEKNEWSLHLKIARQHLSNIPFNDNHSSVLFRYNDLSANWVDESDTNNATRFGYEVDRAVYKHRFNNFTFSFGRQPVDFGSGRLWQPLNVFGAFAPTDLDTDFKPGIDAARLDWFPSDFSSLTGVYTFSPDDNSTIEKNTNTALHYRSQVGQESEYALLAASVIDYQITGASFESAWAGMGWHIEGAHYHDHKTNNDSVFWIAGANYQLKDGTLITAEWYKNSRGADTVASLINLPADNLVRYGLQQHRSQNVFGLSLNKEITPLLNTGYTLLFSPLKESNGDITTSALHQLNFNYSVSNESDILFAFQFANGRGLNASAKSQSEFGHIPASATIRLRFYF